MQQKRTAGLLLALFFSLLFLLDFTGGKAYASSLGSGQAAQGERERYYYGQLPEEAQGFYDAMYNMYVQGILKTGTGDYDLTANGHLSQGQLEGYANGNMTLLSYMGAARDAFYADYPEIFYVDFSYLSLRITKKGTEYRAYLEPGRSENYFVKGFSGQAQVEEAVQEYEARMNPIVEGAEALAAEEGKNLTEQKVKYVHDQLVQNTSYRLENTCQPENTGHIRTAYGALVKGESLCEGYSRAFKAVMDRLGIPCVLVQGGFQVTTDKIEPHMWNYVQIGSEWYGVDTTMDDPVPPLPGEGGMDGWERSDYLLAGDDLMSRRHVPDGVMSEADFEFTYPNIAGQGHLYQEVSNANGLKVLYNEDAIDGGLQTGMYKVSYNGMGAAESIKQGKYMLMRTTKYHEKTNRWEYGRWGYLLPDVYAFTDTETEAVLSVPNADYVEFAVTSEVPGNYNGNEGGSIENLNFHGDPLLFDAYTEVLYNPNGSYVAPPYVLRAAPALTAKILVGQTHHMTVVFDETLELAEGASKAEIEVSISEKNTTALENCKVENFAWDGDSTVTFDFTPSKMWLDDSVTYVFHIKGLVGIESGKAPKSFSHTAANRRSICAYRSKGYYLNMFGRPQLLENSDLSAKDFQQWKTEEGNDVTLEMMTGLTLVASSPTHAQTDHMNNLIGGQLGDKALKSETYNISLLTCNQNILSVGTSIRIAVGFPAGYGPDDEGVTFKAYHFLRDKHGEIIGLEEIPCIVTRYGLVIQCKSFSPFAIVAAADDGAGAKASKSVLLSTTQGGRIIGAESIFTLAEGESKELTVQAEDGYVIEAVVVGGKYQKVTDSKRMAVTASHKDLSEGDIIEAQFVAETVQQKEAARGEALVCPVPVPAQIGLGANAITVKEKEGFEIAPQIRTAEHGIHSFQWYKDGVALKGKTSEKLTVLSASKQDAGKYMLRVTTTSGIASIDSESGVCNVTVTAQAAGNQQPDVMEEPKKPGKVSGLKVTSEQTDRAVLKWKKVSKADGYQILRYNVSLKKFVAVANVSKTSYTDKKKTSGKTYRYKVRAYKKAKGKIYYGSASSEAKIIVKPKAPTGVSVKRLSQTSVQISFKPVKNASYYRIYKYKKGSSKQQAVYKMTAKKLYRYDAKKKKWVYLNRVKKEKNGKITGKLTGLKRTDRNQQYRIQTAVSKSGYQTQYSEKGKKAAVR